MTKPTAARVRQVLHYDPDTGAWTWIVSKANWIKPGSPAGHIDDHGYPRLYLDGRQYRAHILAWLYMTGSWPRFMLDHKDGDRTNNRWLNIRPATKAQNASNAKRYKTNKCGFKGVHLRANGRYLASIQANKKKLHIGVFDTAEEAHEAYRKKALELHGEFARTA